MNRIRRLLLASLAVAITILLSGVGATYAQQDSAPVKPTAEQEAVAAQRKAAAARKARAQRDEAFKKRHETQKYIKKVAEGQESKGAAAPDNAGKEGAK
jgi:murein L,D-transpeptidase YcbB/YkuD